MNNSNEQKTAAGAQFTTAANVALIGQVYIVQSGDYRCIAFKDPRGKWRRYFSNEELGEPVIVIKKFG